MAVCHWLVEPQVCSSAPEHCVAPVAQFAGVVGGGVHWAFVAHDCPDVVESEEASGAAPVDFVPLPEHAASARLTQSASRWLPPPSGASSSLSPLLLWRSPGHPAEMLCLELPGRCFLAAMTA